MHAVAKTGGHKWGSSRKTVLLVAVAVSAVVIGGWFLLQSDAGHLLTLKEMFTRREYAPLLQRIEAGGDDVLLSGVERQQLLEMEVLCYALLGLDAQLTERLGQLSTEDLTCRLVVDMCEALPSHASTAIESLVSRGKQLHPGEQAHFDKYLQAKRARYRWPCDDCDLVFTAFPYGEKPEAHYECARTGGRWD